MLKLSIIIPVYKVAELTTERYLETSAGIAADNVLRPLEVLRHNAVLYHNCP